MTKKLVIDDSFMEKWCPKADHLDKLMGYYYNTSKGYCEFCDILTRKRIKNCFWDYIEKWIIKAVNDLKVAEHELRQPADEIVTDAICFRCQQAVEKLLKAYLASFYAVEIRYPDEFYILSITEAKECFSIASKDMDFLLKKIS